MKTLRECIQEAEEKKVAIGHFNISNIETLWGIWGAARTLNVPVIIGLSEGERDFFGIKQAKAVIKSLHEEFDFPIFINADHSYSYERFKEAIDARFDAAIFDGAKLSIEKNISEAKKCVDYARSVDPEIVTEGELGYIGTSSQLLNTLPEGVSFENLTTPEDAKRFVDETNVDLFAPAVGNVHGMLTTAPEPRLNIERVKEIKNAVKIPLVLHGASGNSEEDIRNAIEAGVSIVHINTEIRVGYRRALEASLQEHQHEVAPYKLLQLVVEEIQKITMQKLRIFNKYQ